MAEPWYIDVIRVRAEDSIIKNGEIKDGMFSFGRTSKKIILRDDEDNTPVYYDVPSEDSHASFKSLRLTDSNEAQTGRTLYYNETTKEITYGDNATGLPEGGTIGQALVKKTNADYDVDWSTVSGGWQTLYDGVGIPVPSDKMPAGTQLEIDKWMGILEIEDGITGTYNYAGGIFRVTVTMDIGWNGSIIPVPCTVIFRVNNTVIDSQKISILSNEPDFRYGFSNQAIRSIVYLKNPNGSDYRDGVCITTTRTFDPNVNNAKVKIEYLSIKNYNFPTVPDFTGFTQIKVASVQAFPSSYFINSDYSGNGLPTGGTKGQTIIKKSDSDLDVEWGNAGIGTGLTGDCPTYTWDSGSGEITIDETDIVIYDNARGVGAPKKYTISEASLSLVDNTLNYIVVNFNSGSPEYQVTTDVSIIKETTILPVISCYRNGIYIHPQYWGCLGNAKVDKIHKSIVETERYRRKSGVIASEYGTRNVKITSGIVWIGGVEVELDECNSTVDNIFYYTEAGALTVVQSYSNFSTINNNRYGIVWIYRGVEDAKHIYMMYSDNAGAGYTFADAQLQQPPVAPTPISSHAVLVSRFIVAKNGTTASLISSTWDVKFNTSGVTSHNDLSDVEGGTLHVTSDEKTKLTWLQPLSGLDNRIVLEKVDNTQTILRIRSTSNASSVLEFSRQTSAAEATISSTLSGLTYYSDYNKHSFNQKVDVTGTGAGYYINDVNINTLFEPTLTKGNLTASGSLAVDNTRQVIGGACAISHLTTTGHKHIPTAGASGNILGWSSDGTATWISPTSQSWVSKWATVTGGIYYGSAGAQSIGVGVQPELWQNVFNAVQVGMTAAFFGTPSTNAAYFTNNVYYNANWKALTSGYGSRMGFDSNGNIDIRGTVNSASAKNETMDFSGTGFLLKPREGAFLFSEKASAPALTSGYHSVYALSSDSSLRSKDDSGKEFLLSAWQSDSTYDLYRVFSKTDQYSPTIVSNKGLIYSNTNRTNVINKFSSFSLEVFGQSLTYDSSINFIAYKPTYTSQKLIFEVQTPDASGNYNWRMSSEDTGFYHNAVSADSFLSTEVLPNKGIVSYNGNTDNVANKAAIFSAYVLAPSGGSGYGAIALVKPSATSRAVDWAFQLRKTDGSYFEHCSMKSTGEIKFNNTADNITAEADCSKIYAKDQDIFSRLYEKSEDNGNRLLSHFTYDYHYYLGTTTNKQIPIVVGDRIKIRWSYKTTEVEGYEAYFRLKVRNGTIDREVQVQESGTSHYSGGGAFLNSNYQYWTNGVCFGSLTDEFDLGSYGWIELELSCHSNKIIISGTHCHYFAPSGNFMKHYLGIVDDGSFDNILLNVYSGEAGVTVANNLIITKETAITLPV